MRFTTSCALLLVLAACSGAGDTSTGAGLPTFGHLAAEAELARRKRYLALARGTISRWIDSPVASCASSSS